MDIQQSNGFQLVQEIRKLNKDIPFLFLNTNFQNGNTNELKLSNCDCITKSLNVDDLKYCIRQKLRLINNLHIQNKRIEVFYHNIVTPVNSIQGFMDMHIKLITQL